MELVELEGKILLGWTALAGVLIMTVFIIELIRLRKRK